MKIKKRILCQKKKMKYNKKMKMTQIWKKIVTNGKKSVLFLKEIKTLKVTKEYMFRRDTLRICQPQKKRHNGRFQKT
jgi:hypothetical protein